MKCLFSVEMELRRPGMPSTLPATACILFTAFTCTTLLSIKEVLLSLFLLLGTSQLTPYTGKNQQIFKFQQNLQSEVTGPESHPALRQGTEHVLLSPCLDHVIILPLISSNSKNRSL